MPVAPQQDPARDLGRRLARLHKVDRRPIRNPYPPETALSDRFLAGWHEVLTEPPLAYQPFLGGQGKDMLSDVTGAFLASSPCVTLSVVAEAERLSRRAPEKPLRVRNGRQVYRWSEEDREQLRRLHAEGLAPGDIARQMPNRTAQQIVNQGYAMHLSWKGRARL